MDTPIFDFVESYRKAGFSRLHVPGHKGVVRLGCEASDITEAFGADSLCEAGGIIKRSEENAASLFGTGATLYSAGGSSQCVRAMLCLALMYKNRGGGGRPLVVAARNVHRSFLSAAALLDFDIEWLRDEDGSFSLCRCRVGRERLERTLASLPRRPAAVYLTSPDYLGGISDVAELSDAAHAYGVPLLVDNAHGAYLRFLRKDAHPISLGADLCCDSAHKTLPVLTGGAYLHIARSAPKSFFENARRAMNMFGSTSPSYLILQSLDLANRYLSDGYGEKLEICTGKLEALRSDLRRLGWKFAQSDPLRLTVETTACGYDGRELARLLRQSKIECEYAEPDFLVLMFTPDNPEEDFPRVCSAFADLPAKRGIIKPCLRLKKPSAVCSVRRALLGPRESVPVEESVGRVFAGAGGGCPPGVPILVPGEVVTESAVRLMKYYGRKTAAVLRLRRRE